jgi:oligoendopeptidase F
MQAYLQVEDRKASRQFVPPSFEVKDWETLAPYFEELLTETPDSVAALEAYLRKRNELEAIVAEAYAWRYIRMTCHTQEKAYEEAFQAFVQQIMPQLSSYSDKLNRKIAANPYFDQLPDDPYLTHVRQLKRQIELFREANIPLSTEAQTTSQQYSALTASMTIEYEGKTLTMQQAGKYLEVQDRAVREAVWKQMQARRDQDRSQLEGVFDQLVGLRHQMAQHAGYDSFTAYKFDAMGRFDYSLADTHAFHEAVETVVKPIYQQLLEERRARLGVDRLRPWDLAVDIFGDAPLVPFDEASQLLDRSMAALSHLRPEMGEMLRIMDRMGYLDLESRPGKAPGGYNYPLMETGVPFIFMNAAGSQVDVITMLHESGHAVHSFVTRDIPLNDLKQPPSEVAELASMSMELLCLDHYDQFYSDEEALRRAQKNQLLRCITIFPWIATVDAFQQWAYDHPDHHPDAREQAWLEIYHRFHGDTIDWTGFEAAQAGLWLKQGHIFDVPFYYIEYAIAQLGALAVWRNYREQPQEALNQYLDALTLGYTRPIPDIYEAAGIRFDFGVAYMRECVAYCLEAYEAIDI